MSVYLWIIIGLFLFAIIGGSIYAIVDCVRSDDALKNSSESAPPADASRDDSAGQEE